MHQISSQFGSCHTGIDPGRDRPAESASFMRALRILAMAAATAAGCSCSQPPVEWDSGLKGASRPLAGREGASAREREQSAGRGDGSGDGSGGGAAESGGGRGGVEGEGASGAASGDGQQGSGTGGEGSPGGTSSEAEGGEADHGRPIAGNATGDAQGAGDERTTPPAAFPGRPVPKPQYDAETAVEVAERQLRRAEAMREEGDVGNAYAAAVQAFEAVAPHADGHDGCRLALARSKRLIAELAKRQNARTVPESVPTLFE